MTKKLDKELQKMNEESYRELALRMSIADQVRCLRKEHEIKDWKVFAKGVGISHFKVLKIINASYARLGLREIAMIRAYADRLEIAKIGRRDTVTFKEIDT